MEAYEYMMKACTFETCSRQPRELKGIYYYVSTRVYGLLNEKRACSQLFTWQIQTSAKNTANKVAILNIFSIVCLIYIENEGDLSLNFIV